MWWPVPTLLFGWKRGVWRGCGGFLSVRFTICAIYLEDLLQAVPFSNQLGVMANIPGSGFQAFDDARLDPSMVVRVIESIYLCVLLQSIDVVARVPFFSTSTSQCQREDIEEV